MVRSQIVQSFVARIWLEGDAGQAPQWRGHIQHIQGKEQAYFRDLAEMSDFLEQMSGVTWPICGTTDRNSGDIQEHGSVASFKRKPGK
ncbi:MAG: hypothetical protein WA210_13080 [Burkholderiaceae bacterium]